MKKRLVLSICISLIFQCFATPLHDIPRARNPKEPSKVEPIEFQLEPAQEGDKTEVPPTVEDVQTTPLPPVPDPEMKLDGWQEVVKGERPPVKGDERYLFASTAGEYELKLSNRLPDFYSDKVVGMEISFQYWTRFEQSPITGLPMLDLAIISCWHTAVLPVPLSALTNGGLAWRDHKYTAHNASAGDEGNFDYTQVSCRNDVSIRVKIDKSEKNLNFVALKNIQVKYTLKAGSTLIVESNDGKLKDAVKDAETTEHTKITETTTVAQEDTTTAAQDDTTTADENSRRKRDVKDGDFPVLRSCDEPIACSNNFYWRAERMSWSRKAEAPMETNTDRYRVPAVNKDSLEIKFTNLKSTTDASITVRHWISAKATIEITPNLTVSPGLFVLFETRNERTGKPEWSDITFKLSDLRPQINEESASIFLRANIHDFDKGDDIASIGSVSIEFENNDKPLVDIAPQFLMAWDHKTRDDEIGSTAQGQWSALPGPYFNGRTSDLLENGTLTFDKPPANAVAYLYSNWIKASNAKNLFLEYQINVEDQTGPPLDISAVVVNSDILPVAYGPAMADGKLNKMRVEFGGEIDEKNALWRVVFMVKSPDKIERKSKITVTRVSLGDGCALNRNYCHANRGYCLQQESANSLKCDCDRGYAGKRCELVDYCLHHKSFSMRRHDMVDGYTRCKDAGASDPFCESHKTKDSIQPYDCICRDNEYWNQENYRCERLSQCHGVIRCPNPNTRCNEDSDEFDSANPCPICVDGYRFNGTTKDCIPEDYCRDKGKADCMVVDPLPGTTAPRGVSFCAVGYRRQMNPTTRTYECLKNTQDGCPHIVRTANNCEQDCDIELGESDHLNVTCKCFDGWTLDLESQRCVKDKDLDCDTHMLSDRICVRIDEDRKVSGKWMCPPGFYPDSKDKCTVSFCDVPRGGLVVDVHRKQKIDVTAEIISVCGGSVDTCKTLDDSLLNSKTGESKRFTRFVCNCTEGQTLDSSTGRCLLVDQCAEGHEFKKSCDDKKQLCKRRGTVTNPKFQCECHPGLQSNKDGECQPQCKIRKNIIECLKKNKVCQMNFQNQEPDCVCQNGFLNKNGLVEDPFTCQLPNFAYRTVPIKFALSAHDALLLRMAREGKSNPGTTTPPTKQVRSTLFNEPPSQYEDEHACLGSIDPRECLKFAQSRSVQDRDQSEIIDQNEKEEVMKKIRTAFRIVYSGHKKFDLLGLSMYDYKRLGDNQYEGVVTLAFGEEVKEADLLNLLWTWCRKKPSSEEGYCYYPGGLNIITTTIGAKDDKPLKCTVINPCEDSDGNGRPYCPESSKCKLLSDRQAEKAEQVAKKLAEEKAIDGKSDEKKVDDKNAEDKSTTVSVERPVKQFQFDCQCPRNGFTIEQIIRMDEKNIDLRKEICVDIDECKLEAPQGGCPLNSTCYNTVGSRNCICNYGLTMSSDELCVGVCKDIKCLNGGECHVNSVATNSWKCKCADGWQGDKCESEDPKVKSWRSGLIASVSVLSVLLLVVIVLAVYMARRRQSPSFQVQRELENFPRSESAATRTTHRNVGRNGQDNQGYVTDAQ